jgi:hypothetical protein
MIGYYKNNATKLAIYLEYRQKKVFANNLVCETGIMGNKKFKNPRTYEGHAGTTSTAAA